MCTQTSPEATAAMVTLDCMEKIPTEGIGVVFCVGRDVTGDYSGFIGRPELDPVGIWNADGMCDTFMLPQDVYDSLGLGLRELCEIELTAKRLPDAPGWEWSAEKEGAS